MPASTSVCAYGFSHSDYETTPLEELAERDGQPDVAASLLADGFRDVACSDRDIAAMAASTIRKTLALAGLSADAVRAVLLCTETMWDRGHTTLIDDRVPDYRRFQEALMRAVFLESGLLNAHPYANWGAGCSNFTTTLTLARALVQTEQYQRVLVVMVERHPPDQPRVIVSPAGNPFVYGDLATSFVVERGETGYIVRHVLVQPSWRSYRALHVDRQGSSGGGHWTVAVKELGRAVEEASGRPINAFDRIVTENLHSRLSGVICAATGIDPSHMWTPGKGLIGHAFSNDVVFGLGFENTFDGLDRGQAVGILNISPWALGFSILDIA